MPVPAKENSMFRSKFLMVFIPAFIGLHIGWYMLQERYVPESERHDHPFVRIYKKYT